MRARVLEPKANNQERQKNVIGARDASGAMVLAYPEPIPAIKGKRAREFLERLNEFDLSKSQKELYRGARDSYHKTKK